MVPGLSGGKMSSSDPKSKIDFLDSPADVKSKLKAAVCTPGVVENNGVLAFVKNVLIPVQELRNEQAESKGESAPRGEGSFVKSDAPEGTIFSISRPEKFGGDIHYSSYEAMETAYAKEELHPSDLKNGVTDALNTLLAPIQAMFNADPEWQKVEKAGYPEAVAVTGTAKTTKVGRSKWLEADARNQNSRERDRHLPKRSS
jgi:tyrosyl-tRNA synthetase